MLQLKVDSHGKLPLLSCAANSTSRRSAKHLAKLRLTTFHFWGMEITGDQARPSAPTSAINATPATQNEGACVWKLVCLTKFCVKVGVCESWCVTKCCVTKLCWKLVCDKVVCERWCVWQSVVWQSCVERWCVTKLCVKESVKVVGVQSCVKESVKVVGVVKVGVWQSCVPKKVWKLLVFKVVSKKVWKLLVLWKLVCDKLCVKESVKVVGVQSCVKESAISCWCVTKLCVKDGMWQRWCVTGGRREEAGGGRRPGIQNQKQEPHTKLRGKNPES